MIKIGTAWIFRRWLNQDVKRITNVSCTILFVYDLIVLRISFSCKSYTSKCYT